MFLGHPFIYKIVSNIVFSSLTPYVDEVIRDRQCEFGRNKSATEQIFCIRQILEKRRQYKGKVPRLLIDFEKVYYIK
jgi:hypothetical protein